MSQTNSVEHNRRLWDQDYAWPEDGDEWNGQAADCGQPYPAWKAALVQEFLEPRVQPDATLLEIGPGHGRWTEYIAGRCRKLYLVDLSPTCLEFCRSKFQNQDLECVATNGHSLAGVPDGAVDFAWSYDCFVHIGPADTAGYLADLRRVLKPGAAAVIHHAGRRDAALPLEGMRRCGSLGLKLYTWMSLGSWSTDEGWRSPMSRARFARLARAAGLEVVRQQQEFGPGGAFAVRRYGDWITTLRRPVSGAGVGASPSGG